MYANAVSFFKEAKLRPIQVQKRCAMFFEGEFKDANRYNYRLIIVENSDEDVQVTFYLTDAHEMNWVTEFLDAPFFAQAETKKLFDLMNSRGSAQLGFAHRRLGGEGRLSSFRGRICVATAYARARELA